MSSLQCLQALCLWLSPSAFPFAAAIMPSQSSPVYIPVHRRTGSTPSSSRPSSGMLLPVNGFGRRSNYDTIAQPYIYSMGSLLALAPPSHIHGTDFHSPSSSPTKAGQEEPHQGWVNLNAAMRNYLRVACPEIALNRKMRKALEFHQFHQHRMSRMGNRDESKKTKSRGSSRQRSSRSSSPNLSEAEDRPKPTVPKRSGAPSRISAAGLRHSHSPNHRGSRSKPHQPHPSVSDLGGDNWRTVTRQGIVAGA